jgi:hypothetical protein
LTGLWLINDETVALYSIASLSMKSRLSFCIILIAVLYYSCQDKYPVNLISPATGTLKQDTTGNCLPQQTTGTFIAGKATSDSDFLQITVLVKSAGTYSIRTNTVNGFSFSGSGSFAATGITTVKLRAAGTPITTGVNDFTIQFDTSVCHVSVPVVSGASAAVYAFDGAPGTCANFILSGAYVKGVPLDTFYKVAVPVKVSTAGSYSISTNTVNGYAFSGKGNFTNTGTQTVYLYAAGTPAVPGTDLFTMNGLNSSCGFLVPVLTAVSVGNTDHFPLTTGSFWNYSDLFNTGDTLSRSVSDSTRTNGFLYKQITEQPMRGVTADYLYRKNGNDYFEYISVDKYTASVKFNPKINKDFLFLKEGLNTGDTWTSDEYTGTADFGQQIYLRYDFTCINNNATVTLGGNTFAGVYKILMQPKIRSAITYPYNGTGEKVDIWYARGIGVIYSKKINNNFTMYEQQIRGWIVK